MSSKELHAIPNKKGDQCRFRILDAARKLFYQKGFAATSINDVAEAAGVLKGNLSYYFSSKSELLESTTAAREAEIRIQLASWPTEGSLYDVINAAISSFESSANDIAAYGCDIGTLTNELGKGNGELQNQPRQILDLLHGWMTERFAVHYPKGEAREYAEHLLTMTQGAAVLAHAYRDPKIIQRQCKLIRTWLQQLSAP
jgi:AcrR family transcriptional regulator